MVAPKPSRAPSRLRKVARISGIVLGSLIGLVVLVLVTAVLVIRSDWGHRRILAIALPQVEKILTGKLTVGRLDGDVLHWLALRDVELTDAEGHPAARVKSVEARYNLLALLSRTLHVTSVKLEGGAVDVRFLNDGRLNLAALVKPSDSPSPPSERLPLRFLIHGVEAEVDLKANLAKPGKPPPEQGAEQAAEAARQAVKSAAATDKAPAVAVKDAAVAAKDVAVATPVIDHAAVHVSLRAALDVAQDKSLHGRIEAVRLQLSDPLRAELVVRGEARMTPAPLDSPAGTLPVVSVTDLTLGLRTDGTEVSKVVPAAAIRGPLGLDAKINGTLETLVAQLDLSLPAGSGRIDTTLNLVDPRLPWKLALALRGLEPAALRPDLPALKINLALSGEGLGPSGRVNLTELLCGIGPNTVKLSGFVEAPVTPPIWKDPLAAKGELVLGISANDLRALTQVPVLAEKGAPPLRGSLGGHFRVGLLGRTLRVNADLTGSELRGFDASVGRLHLSVDTVNLNGRVQLGVERLSVARQDFSRLALSLRGTPQNLNLSLDGNGPQETQFKLAVAAQPALRPGPGLGGQTITGLGAQVTELTLSRRAAGLALASPIVARIAALDTGAPVIDVDTFRLLLAGQPVTLAGHFEAGPKRLRALADLKQLDVHELGRAVLNRTDLPKTRIDLHAEVGGTVAAPSGQVTVHAEVAELPQLPWRTTHELSASLSGRRVRGTLASRALSAATAQASDEELPSIKASFDAPLQPSGAVSLDLQAGTSLAAVQRLLPPDVKPLTGTVAVQASVKGSFERPDVALAVTLPSWEFDPVRGQDTALRVGYAQERLQASFDARVFARPHTNKVVAVGPGASADKGPQQLGVVKLVAQVPLRLSVKTTGPDLMQQLRTAASTLRLELRELALPQILKTTGAGLDEDGEPLVRKGVAELLIDASGPVSTPAMSITLNSRDLALAFTKEQEGMAVNAGLHLGYKQDQLSLTARVDKDVQPILSVRADTRISLNEALKDAKALLPTLPLSAAVDLNVDPQRMPKGVPLQGLIEAHVKVTGTVAKPAVSALVKGSAVALAGWPVGDLDVSGTFDPEHVVRVKAKIVQVPTGPAAAAKGKTPGSLQVSAVVPLPFDLASEATTATLKADGFRLDYNAPLGAGGLRYARGVLSADLKVQGAKKQPLAQGSLRLGEGELSMRALGQPIDNIEVVVDVSREGILTLQKATAKSGGGSVQAKGKVELSEATLKNLELSAQASRFPVAAGPLALWLDTRVDVKGEAKGETLRVKVKIPGGVVHLPRLTESRSVQAIGPLEDVVFVDAAALREAAAKARAAEQEAREAARGTASSPPILLPTRTLVGVELADFSVSGPEVKTDVAGHVDLEMNSDSKQPVVTGEVHTIGGTVEILGRRYQIERGQVSLSGEVPPNPLLNVQISRKVDDAVIYVVVSGSAEKPAITFRSDPPMDQGQIIAIVLSGSKSGGRIQQQALGALSGLLVGQLKDQLGGAVPVDVIKFDVAGSDPSGANQSSVEVGKYLRDDLYLSYTHRFGNPSTILKRLNENQAAIEWSFLRSYQLYLMGGDQGVGALNLYWSKRF